MSSDSLVDMMEKYKDNYYQTNGKNSFFKKNQKIECAKEVSQAFNLGEMVRRSIYRISNSNKVVFNYSVFKLYANPDNYGSIVQEVLNVYDDILLDYPSFEAHIILEGFTISAAERYKSAIQLFCQKCMNSTTKYARLTEVMVIYYTPAMIDNISALLRPFIDTNVGDRIVTISKADSEEALRKLSVFL